MGRIVLLLLATAAAGSEICTTAGTDAPGADAECSESGVRGDEVTAAVRPQGARAGEDGSA